MSDHGTLQAELDLVRKANEVLSEQWQRRANAMSHELDALRKELAITRWERNALARVKQMREEQQGLRLSRAFELLFIDDMQNALAEDMWAAIFGRIEMLMETDGAEGHIKAHGKGQESVMQLVAGAVGDGCPADSMTGILEAIVALRRERDEATARRERVIEVQQEIARERDAALKERDQWRESAEAGWAQAADLARQEEERTQERDEARATLKELLIAATPVASEVMALKAEARDAYRKGGPAWRAARDAASRYTVFTAERQDLADDVCARLSDGALRLSPLLAACNRASVGGYEGPADDAEAVAELRRHLRLTSGSVIDAVAALAAVADKVTETAKQLQPPQGWRKRAECWAVVEAALPRWRAVTETEPRTFQDAVFRVDDEKVAAGWRRSDSDMVRVYGTTRDVPLSRITGWQPLPPAGPVAPPLPAAGDVLTGTTDRSTCARWPSCRESEPGSAGCDYPRCHAGPAPKEPPDAPPGPGPGPGSPGVPAGPAAGADPAAPAPPPLTAALDLVAKGPPRLGSSRDPEDARDAQDAYEAARQRYDEALALLRQHCAAPPAGQALAEGGPAGVEAAPAAAPLSAEVRALAEEVLRLDGGLSSVGPWIADLEDGAIRDADEQAAICHIQRHANVNTVRLTGQEFSHADARLIATYRTAAPALARAVLATPAVEPVPCAGCEALTKERDAALHSARVANEAADENADIAAQNYDDGEAAVAAAHRERDTAQAEVLRLRGERLKIAAQVNHVHNGDGDPAKAVLAIAEVLGPPWHDPDPRAAGPGGADLPEPLTEAERGELSDLRRKVEGCALGDRPQSPAVATLRRLAELEAREGKPSGEVRGYAMAPCPPCVAGKHGECPGRWPTTKGDGLPCPCNCHKIGVAPLQGLLYRLVDEQADALAARFGCTPEEVRMAMPTVVVQKPARPSDWNDHDMGDFDGQPKSCRRCWLSWYPGIAAIGKCEARNHNAGWRP